jgi:hypothetical protein
VQPLVSSRQGTASLSLATNDVRPASLATNDVRPALRAFSGPKVIPPGEGLTREFSRFQAACDAGPVRLIQS